MKTLLSFLILSFSNFGLLNAQYTSIPDPQFEQLLENMGVGDDIPGNGLVLTERIDTVTVLDANLRYINDFTGIEDFSSLVFFNASMNPFSEIDLSHNTNLELLGLAYLNHLTSVDLSNLTKLRHLTTYRSFVLSEITLGYKPNLEILEAHEVGVLTSIDLSQCPALVELFLSENSLSSLDITQNENLEWLRIDDNNLSELDTSGNPNLEILDSGHNPITHYDFTQNPMLRYFSEGHNQALTYIDLRNGNNENIDSFYATLCDNLKCIYVDDTSAPFLENWHVGSQAHFVNNEEECDALGTDELFARRLMIYPNPAKDRLTVLSGDLKIDEIRLTDVSGKIVKIEKPAESEFNFDLSGLPSGIYFVTAYSGKTKFRTEKIIKN